MSDLYLGLDLSTQSLKAVVIDSSSLRVVHDLSVNFDSELPKFGTKMGHYWKPLPDSSDGAAEAIAPIAMWLEAVDMLFDKLIEDSVDFSRIVAISGDAQQHGVVAWANNINWNFDPFQPLACHLQDSFSKLTVNIWLDCSTRKQCAALGDIFGVGEILSKTGSIPTERFAAAQIMKIVQDYPEIYKKTSQFSLISSFMCSLFVGHVAPIDYNEASGTNLFDFNSRPGKWWTEMLAAIDPSGCLESKLKPEPVHSSQVVGRISPYFTKRFGFSPNCQILAFTGDNAASVFSAGLRRGDAMLTLGTSDCVTFITDDQARPSKGCHVFVSPIMPNEFMVLCCFKNGSVAREMVRDRANLRDWDQFDAAVGTCNAANDGQLGVYFFVPESTPTSAIGVFRVDCTGKHVESFASKAIECRAVLEGQLIARKFHAIRAGFNSDRQTSRILLTGGASKSSVMAQIVADVFGVETFGMSSPNSAAYGSALRAMHGLGNLDYIKSICNGDNWAHLASPRLEFADCYAALERRYEAFVPNFCP